MGCKKSTQLQEIAVFLTVREIPAADSAQILIYLSSPNKHFAPKHFETLRAKLLYEFLSNTTSAGAEHPRSRLIKQFLR